ncbi:MAG: cation:proton antiporter [Candidatus Methanoperedenaceae archaeon]|nr:cation:proton antiporter [Candidatus Methanoperedenaceae archaeon]
MEILLQIFLILFLAKVLGEVIERAGFPGILGEISAGVIVGFVLLRPDIEILSFLAELGAVFLLFTAGYREVHLKELRTATKKALIPTVIQIIFVFYLGFLVARVFGFGLLESLFMGVAFSPTSIGVTVKTLIDLDYLSSRVGSMILSSAILDDIIGIFMLSVFATFATLNQLPSILHILIITGKLVLFILIMFLLGWKIYPVIFNYIHRMHVKESIFSFVVMIALLSAYLATLFGLHSVIGAFIGGLLLSNIPFAKIEGVQDKVSGLAYGILVPFFFAFIGLSIDTGTLITGYFTVFVVATAIIGKLVGGFIGSRIVGFGNYDSLFFGAGMIPRAEVGLVILAVGKSAGIVSIEMFSAIVFMVVSSIIVSPVLLKLVTMMKEKSNKAVL